MTRQRRSAARPLLQERPEALALARIERRGRLVEQHHRWVAEQADGDVHALAVAAREALDEIAAPVRQPGAGEHRVDRPVDVRDALEPREQPQVLLDRQPPVDRQALRHPADPIRSVDRSAVGALRAGEDLEHRRLARAVRPDDREHLAAARRTGRRPSARRARHTTWSGPLPAAPRERRLRTRRPPRGPYFGRLPRVPEAEATILFIGDVVGGLGRRTLLGLLPELRERHAPTFVVVNGENAAGGLGITPQIADEMFGAGVDAITLGNHAYHRREILRYLDESERIVRPANYLRAQPGRGSCIVESDGLKLGVANLSGNVFLNAGRPAFDDDRGHRRRPQPARLRPHPRRHARRGHEREGRDGLVPRRPRERRRRHAHAHPDGRRTRAAGRHRLHHGRRDDRAARWRDRRQEGACDRVARHADAHPLRDLGGRSVAQRRRHPLLAATAG